MPQKKRKGMALANGLTAAGVVLLLGALAALPEAPYWLPDALTGDLEYIRWFLADMMPVFVSATAGAWLPVRRAPAPHRPPLAQKDRQYCR